MIKFNIQLEFDLKPIINFLGSAKLQKLIETVITTAWLAIKLTRNEGW